MMLRGVVIHHGRMAKVIAGEAMPGSAGGGSPKGFERLRQRFAAEGRCDPFQPAFAQRLFQIGRFQQVRNRHLALRHRIDFLQLREMLAHELGIAAQHGADLFGSFTKMPQQRSDDLQAGFIMLHGS